MTDRNARDAASATCATTSAASTSTDLGEGRKRRSDQQQGNQQGSGFRGIDFPPWSLQATLCLLRRFPPGSRCDVMMKQT